MIDYSYIATGEDYDGELYGNEDSYLDSSYEDRTAEPFDSGEWYGDDYDDDYPNDYDDEE